MSDEASNGTRARFSAGRYAYIVQDQPLIIRRRKQELRVCGPRKAADCHRMRRIGCREGVGFEVENVDLAAL